MKKALAVLVIALLVGVAIQPILFAADEQKAPEAQKAVEILPDVIPAQGEEVAVEEENEDVKNLKEAAAKLRKGEADSALADKLDALAEDLSW